MTPVAGLAFGGTSCNPTMGSLNVQTVADAEAAQHPTTVAAIKFTFRMIRLSWAGLSHDPPP
ncbi:MAG: hypothetical protein HBSAPP03_04670 [Phycisphaerae bacterium]|nr:MAG: hypothetical protein HBSAPP03_04670 [Phycisphaerae bacterium]